MATKDKSVVVRLTPEEALIVWLSVDGWVDAGSCEDGLEPKERAALDKVREQIRKQIRPA